MGDVLISKALRHRFKAALTGLTVKEGDADLTIAVLDRPPSPLPEDKLPALYVFEPGQRVTDRNISSELRQQNLDVVLLASPGGDPLDMLDDMQLAVEQALAGAKAAAGGGLVFGIAQAVHFQSASVQRSAEAPAFANRTLHYDADFGCTRDDPAL